ncbi:MAG: hypothetical protein HFE63_03410, partial [Clostridiales bacterium]|nr:hypothetical protein [Clostridiales bacterium]
GNLKEAWRQLLAVVGQPVLKLALPVVKSMTSALQRMTEAAQSAWQALQRVFGWEDVQATAISSAAEAQDELTAAVEATEKTQEGALAGFDEIQTLTDKSATSDTEVARTFAIPSIDTSTGIDTGSSSRLDAVAAAIENIREKIEPTIAALSNLWNSVKLFSMPFGEGLSAFYSDILLPMGEWAITTGLPIAINAISDALERVNEIATLAFEFFSGKITFEDFISKLSDVEIVLNSVAGAIGTVTIAMGLFETVSTLAATSSSILSTIMSALTNPVFWVVASIAALVAIVLLLIKHWDELSEKMGSNGKSLFDNVKGIIDNIKKEFVDFKNNVIDPICNHFMDIISDLWDNHLSRLWGHLKEFFESFMNNMTAIYNTIKPLLKLVYDILCPIITDVTNLILSLLGDIFAYVIDVVDGIIQVLTGVINFLTGLFTWDFELALSGIVDIFKGVINIIIGLFESGVNFIIDIVNSLLDGVVWGINRLISALNTISFDIPDWIPFVGGEHFGVNIPEITDYHISRLSIPRLASGAVIPPNREFLAVLGDQKQGMNIEAPLETIKQAFREAMAESGGGTAQHMTVILQVGRRELGRTIVELGREEEQRVGLRVRA